MSLKQNDIFFETKAEKEEEMKKICRAFGWKYFKNRPLYNFTNADVIANINASLNDLSRALNL